MYESEVTARSAHPILPIPRRKHRLEFVGQLIGPSGFDKVHKTIVEKPVSPRGEMQTITEEGLQGFVRRGVFRAGQRFGFILIPARFGHEHAPQIQHRYRDLSFTQGSQLRLLRQCLTNFPCRVSVVLRHRREARESVVTFFAVGGFELVFVQGRWRYEDQVSVGMRSHAGVG